VIKIKKSKKERRLSDERRSEINQDQSAPLEIVKMKVIQESINKNPISNRSNFFVDVTLFTIFAIHLYQKYPDFQKEMADSKLKYSQQYAQFCRIKSCFWNFKIRRKGLRE